MYLNNVDKRIDQTKIWVIYYPIVSSFAHQTLKLTVILCKCQEISVKSSSYRYSYVHTFVHDAK